MPYIHVSDFKYGMDRRRPQVAGVPGTLWIAENCFVGRGGDIERARKFVSTYDLPDDTFGFGAIKDQLFVFGSASAPTMPVGVQYQRLQAASANMERVLDVKPFDNALYVVAEFDDGGVYHFYDGAQVTDWNTIADANSSFETVAQLLAVKVSADSAIIAQTVANKVIITAKVAGTAFTCVGAATDGAGASTTPTATATELVANVAEVAEVLAIGRVKIATGSSGSANKIVSVTVNGVELLGADVFWTSSNEATANALANEINNNTATHNYTAAVLSGSTVTISAAVGTGSTPNGYVVASTPAGDVTTADTNMFGGVDYVAPVAQVYEVEIDESGGPSTYDATDLWKITLNGTLYQTTGRGSGVGRSIFIQKKRVWSPTGGILRGCVLEDATDWTTTTDPADDALFINLASEAEGADRIVGAAKYQGNAAIFSRDAILIYALFADAQDISIVDTLADTGTMASRSIVSYGNLDVYYLDETGIRSVRSRDGYDAAYISDVGSAIDSFVQEYMATVGQDTLQRAVAVIDPVDGRYLLAIGTRIFGLSYYPTSKITAWSYIDPGFDVEDMIRVRRKIYARSGDTIYLYGGADGDTYPDADELEAVVETAFLDAKDPASFKNAEWLDIALENDWLVEVLVDPNDRTKKISLGVTRKTTYNLESHRMVGYAPMVALRFTCSAAGNASLSNFAFGYGKVPAH